MRGLLVLYNEKGVEVKKFVYFHRDHRTKEMKKWRQRYGKKFLKFFYHLIPDTNEEMIKRNGMNRGRGRSQKLRAKENVMKARRNTLLHMTHFMNPAELFQYSRAQWPTQRSLYP